MSIQEVKEKHKVSIVIPVYNAAEYLERCIESILNQKYGNIEVIMIDDGSTDQSWKIISNYQNQYPDKIVAIHQENMGVSKTRNKGILLATGKYLMFMDNDDYIDADYIESFYNAIVKNDCDVAIGGYKRPNSEGTIIEKVELPEGEYAKFKIVTAWGKIYKTKYIVDNKIEFLVSNIGEDIHFTIQAVLLTKNICLINNLGYNWFYNEKSVSNTLHRDVNKELQIEYLMDSVYTKLVAHKIEMDQYLEYYFIKLIIWYLFYSTKKANKQLVYSEYQKMFNWLEVHFPKYKKNQVVGFFTPKGETTSKCLIIKIFMIMHKMHIGKIFLYVYSRL